MPKKIGRPTENPKIYNTRIRMSKDTVEKLDYCAKQKQISKSDVIREGIELVKKEIDGK